MDKWISVNDRLPNSGRRILAYYKNNCGKDRIVKAEYIHPLTEFAVGYYDDSVDYEADYDKTTDEYYVKEGWYELVDNWEYSGYEITEGNVTHWMPLPEPPKE